MRNLTKRISLFSLAVLMMGSGADAQIVTHNHDAAKMNQITVQEIGVGSLTPPFYYQLLHNIYQKSAAVKNKLAFRTQAGISAYQQISDADSIKVSLEKRAEIEELNMADRQVDIAWLAERNHIESKLSDFQANIDRIIGAGGTDSDMQRWREYCNIFRYSIRQTQDAYMPNSQRKKEYLAIYADICRQNETLISFLVQLDRRRKTDELLTAAGNRSSHKAEYADAAYTRWRESALRDRTGGSGMQDETDITER